MPENPPKLRLEIWEFYEKVMVRFAELSIIYTRIRVNEESLMQAAKEVYYGNEETLN